MVKSIFELERRFDFNKEFKRLLNMLDQKIYNCEYRYYKNQSFWTIADKYFTEWKYRLSAINTEQYFYDLEIDFQNLESCDNTQKMYVLQFLDSYIMYLINNYKIDRHANIGDEPYKPFIAIIENIGLIITKLNFERDIDKEKEYITYIKRDADVDSVLSIIESEDDLRLSLLEYNDFRIENDIQQKKIILKKIGDYLEPQRKELSNYNNSLTDDIFYILNNFSIRHNNQKQITLDNTKLLYWYDVLFKMMIQIIREKQIKNYHTQLVEEYKH